jgi:hypothetical protein
MRAAILAAIVAAGTVFSDSSIAYVLSGPTWNSGQVPYYVNARNLDLSSGSLETAVRYGADTWHLQTGAGVHLLFAGQSPQSTATVDHVNVVMFRDASNGSAIATTYWWSSGSRIVDADIVFWDGAFRFFAGTTGCSGGFYIEDIAAHEFGHMLGLGHATSSDATMYSSTSWCHTGNRSLHPDDIAGVRALYPPVLAPPRAPTGLRFTY